VRRGRRIVGITKVAAIWLRIGCALLPQSATFCKDGAQEHPVFTGFRHPQPAS
jgi:hypothetical protein